MKNAIEIELEYFHEKLFSIGANFMSIAMKKGLIKIFQADKMIVM